VNLFGTKNAPKAVQPIKSESSEIESKEDEECLYCRGTYLGSKQEEDWACYKQCCQWAHENCDGVEEGDDFICDLCM
jgi:hypothetical protein